MVEFPGQPSAGLLERNRELPGYSHLGASLGGMFFNGAANDARQQQIFTGAAKGEVSLEDAVMKARKEREEYLARHSMEQRYRESDPDLADLAMGAGTPISAQGLGEYFLRKQERDQRNSIMGEAQSGGAITNRLNAELAALHGQPVQLSTIQGDTLLNQYETPGTHPLTTTERGKAYIADEQAAARAHDAAANASNASAERQRAGIDADKAGFYQYFTNPDDGSIWKVDARDDLHPRKVGGEEGFGGAHMYKVGTEPKPV